MELGKIFILEEPELHLHPSIQNRLAAFLQQSSSQNQLFIITHSPYFLHLDSIPHIIRISAANGESHAKSYDFSVIKQSRIDRQAPIVDEAIILAHYKRVSHVGVLTGFFAKMIVLCEGETEYLSLRVWGQILGRDFDKENITIIQAMAKTSLIELAELFESFNIPIFLIFDMDDPGDKYNIILAEFAEKASRGTISAPPPTKGNRYYIMDQNYEEVLRLDDNPYYALAEDEINSIFELRLDSNKGLRAYHVAIKYLNENKTPPIHVTDQMNTIWSYLSTI